MDRRLRLGLSLAALTALAAAWLLSPALGGHGLSATHGGGVQALERVAFVTSNDGPAPGGTLPVSWTGFLYQPRAGRAVFRIPANVRASLVIGTQLVYDTALTAPADQRAAVELAAGVHPVRLVVSAADDLNRYFDAGLEWQTPVGWRLVPAVYLYPEQPVLTLARMAVDRARWAGWLAGMAVVCGIILAAVQLWAWRRQIGSPVGLRLLALVLLALSARLIFLRDVSAQPQADVLSAGADQRGYQENALALLRGTWPTGPFYMGPGISLTLGAIYTVFGPHLRAAQAAQMLGGALAVLPMVDFSRRVFGARAGWLTGLLWAAFPFPVFYEAYTLTHGLEAIAGAALLWLWLKGLDDTRWLILLGVVLGAAGILRPNFLALAPVIAFTVFWRNRPAWRRMLGRPALLAAVTCLTIAPITWHNYQTGGRFQLISSEAPNTLYAANTRDGAGHGEETPASQVGSYLVGRGRADYVGLTLADIRANPLRWLQLELRKFALYWSDTEYPNNVSFVANGTAISPFLGLLPLRFGLVVTLALTGALLTLFRRERPGWGQALLTFYIVVHLAVTITFSVISRFRAPNFPALVIAAGAGVAALLTPARRRDWGALRLGLAVLGTSAAFSASLPLVADNVMSWPTLRMLPRTVRPAAVALGDVIVITGYEPFSAARPGEPMALTLYWQARQPVATDLFVTLQLFTADSSKVAQADHMLGGGAFPFYATSRWQVGQIIRDEYLFIIPDGISTPQALSLLVAVYDRSNLMRWGEAWLGPLPLTTGRALSVPPDAAVVGAHIGTARLAAAQLGTRAGGLVTTLYWESGGPMAEDGVVFLHVFDAAGNFIAGRDVRPRDGLYSTRAWQPGEGIVDEHWLELPPDLPPGTYRVAVGMYDAATQIRLPVFDEAGQPVRDNVLTLGSIQLP